MPKRTFAIIDKVFSQSSLCTPQHCLRGKYIYSALMQKDKIKKDHHNKWRSYEQLNNYYNSFAFAKACSKTPIAAGLRSMAVEPRLSTFLRVSGWSSDVIMNTGTGIKRGSRRRYASTSVPSAPGILISRHTNLGIQPPPH